MKVITKSELVWDEEQRRYVVTFEESHEYDGPVAEAKGGGKDPSKEMRKQEQERQRKIQESMNAINRIFGGPIQEYTYYDPYQEALQQQEQQRAQLEQQAREAFQQQYGGRLRSNRDEQEFIQNYVNERLPQQSSLALSRLRGQGEYRLGEKVESPGQFGDDYFKSIADSFMEFQTPLFEEQAQEALRKLPFAFASTDNSDYQRTLAQLQADIERERAQLKDRALEFSNKQRQQIENTRADLVSLAQSGTDANAISQMAASRAAALAEPPTFEPISDLFAKYTAMASNAAAAGGMGGGYNPYRDQRPLIFNSSRNAQRIVQ